MAGTRIRNLREQTGITQHAMAKEVGVSEFSLEDYETGKRIPRDEVKLRIARFFGVSVRSIFCA